MDKAETEIDTNVAAQPMWRAQIENLYVEAMVLADEAFAGFAATRDRGADRGDSLMTVNLACESLKTTTRLMHIIAWLLHQRAMLANEPSAHAGDSAARIGDPVAADWMVCQHFDASLARIIMASERLFDRVVALEISQRTIPEPPPVHQLIARLEARF